LYFFGNYSKEAGIRMAKKHYTITKLKEIELIKVIDAGSYIEFQQYDYDTYQYHTPIRLSRDKLAEFIKILEGIENDKSRQERSK
jgi:hypothetical protein